MNYDLEFRIQELESKFSKDMSETTFNELKELKKKQKIQQNQWQFENALTQKKW